MEQMHSGRVLTKNLGAKKELAGLGSNAARERGVWKENHKAVLTATLVGTKSVLFYKIERLALQHGDLKRNCLAYQDEDMVLVWRLSP